MNIVDVFGWIVVVFSLAVFAGIPLVAMYNLSKYRTALGNFDDIMKKDRHFQRLWKIGAVIAGLMFCVWGILEVWTS